MKKIGKFLSVSLAAAAFAVCIQSCGRGGGTSDSGSETIPVAVADAEVHTVEGTLHKINVKETNRPFVGVMGSEYKVVVGEENDALIAAAFIIHHIKEATGTELAYEKNPVWSFDAKYIVLGDGELFAQAGLSMPDDDIGYTGYYIKTTGNSAFIATKGPEGYQLGAIRFLSEVIGYDMLSADCVVYEKSGETLPDMEIVERPDYDYRAYSEPVGKAAQYGMGYTNNNILMAINGCSWHNSFQYLPPETYLAEHPEWYDSTTKQYNVTSATKGQNYGQLCYLAGGDEESFELMVETAYQAVKPVFALYPYLSNITLTQEDNYFWCDCEACTESKEKYGGSNAGTVIKFLNRLAEKVEEGFEAEGSDRQVIISFFAYRSTKQSPTTSNADGTFTAIDGIHCHKNVGVVIAPIEATYSHSFYEEENAADAENIISWSAVCDNIYMWLYQTNFAEYLYPLGTWDTVAESYRFCKENNAVYMYNEGQWNTNNVSHFSKLKEYIDSKLLIDVNLNYNDLVEKFFRYYYGEAGEYMREFFDGVQAQYRYLETAYPAIVKGGYRDSIASASYWPKKMLTGWLGLIEKSYEAIEKYKVGNPAAYESYRKHIMLESIFPRYALCTLYSGTYSSDELYDMRSSFKEDCVALGVLYRDEHTKLSDVYGTWGV